MGTPLTPAPGRQKQTELEASLVYLGNPPGQQGYAERPCLKTKTKTKQKNGYTESERCLPT